MANEPTLHSEYNASAAALESTVHNLLVHVPNRFELRVTTTRRTGPPALIPVAVTLIAAFGSYCASGSGAYTAFMSVVAFFVTLGFVAITGITLPIAPAVISVYVRKNQLMRLEDGYELRPDTRDADHMWDPVTVAQLIEQEHILVPSLLEELSRGARDNSARIDTLDTAKALADARVDRVKAIAETQAMDDPE